jgi:hypothetical protein
MGLPAADAYRDRRKGIAPGLDASEKADPARYATLVEPELREAPILPA